MEKNKRKLLPQIIVVGQELDKRYDFRYNEVKEMPEYSVLNQNQYYPANKHFINSLEVKLLKSGIGCKKSLLETILYSDMVASYNPFKSYFNSLPKWDSDNISEIQKLMDTVCTTNQGFFEKCFRRWIIGLVACAINEDDTNQQMIVFSGNQGIGKSRWINTLVPEELKNYYYSGSIDLKNKDTSIYLSESFLINLDELTNLNGRETGHLKEVITKDCINLRRVHGKHNKRLTRRASFIGSINETEFLYDLTGSRRFLSFELKDINPNHNIDINLVYAEAKYLLDTGEQYYFTKEEVAEIHKNNEQFRAISPLEEKIEKKWVNEALDGDFEGEDLTPLEIYTKLYGRETTKISDLTKVGKIMTKLNFTKLKKRGKTYYAVFKPKDF